MPLSDFLPQYDFSERHQTVVAAPRASLTPTAVTPLPR